MAKGFSIPEGFASIGRNVYHKVDGTVHFYCVDASVDVDSLPVTDKGNSTYATVGGRYHLGNGHYVQLSQYVLTDADKAARAKAEARKARKASA